MNVAASLTFSLSLTSLTVNFRDQKSSDATADRQNQQNACFVQAHLGGTALRDNKGLHSVIKSHHQRLSHSHIVRILHLSEAVSRAYLALILSAQQSSPSEGSVTQVTSVIITLAARFPLS